MPSTEAEKQRAECNHQSNVFLGVGLGLGAYAATTAITLSFVCPVCVVTAPILLGIGVYKKIKARTLPDDQTIPSGKL